MKKISNENSEQLNGQQIKLSETFDFIYELVNKAIELVSIENTFISSSIFLRYLRSNWSDPDNQLFR